MKNALIYRDKNIQNSLLLCSFRRIIVVDFPLGPMSSIGSVVVIVLGVLNFVSFLFGGCLGVVWGGWSFLIFCLFVWLVWGPVKSVWHEFSLVIWALN